MAARAKKSPADLRAMISAVRPDEPFWDHRARGEAVVDEVVWMMNQMPKGPARIEFVKGFLLGIHKALGGMAVELGTKVDAAPDTTKAPARKARRAA